MGAPMWQTAGQQKHVVVERRQDDEGRPFVRTRCNWLFWPDALDARLVDPPRCQTCVWITDSMPTRKVVPA
ncbi:hypothetical protein BAY59_24225 [Prauserella coralliicola]|nr:hypothetical protein BAY59_24225 [Prauserella coralliicola]